MGYDDKLHFCVCCFATEEDGSWGCTVVGSVHCLNCGAGNSSFPLPRWATEEIRRNASWVGKRFYPSDEDVQRAEERRQLLKLVQTFPGRIAEEMLSEKPRNPENRVWKVKQDTGQGRWSMVFVEAPAEAEALELARYLLPYVPAVTQ